MKKPQTLKLRKNEESKKHNLIELLKTIFSERKDKNDRVIPASLSIKKKKELIDLEEKKPSDLYQSDNLLSMVKISDPEFKVLAEIAVTAMDRKNKMNNTLRETLLGFCTLTVSRYSILKIQNKDDIYKDLLKDKRNYLSQLSNAIKDKYSKRISGLKTASDKRKNVEDNDSDKLSDTIEKYKLDKPKLISQRDNVITIGAIYGLFNNVVNHRDLIDYFYENFYTCKYVNEVDVALYIIKNRNKNEIKKSLCFYKQQSINKDNEITNIKEQVRIKDEEISHIDKELIKIKNHSDKLSISNDELTTEIQNLKDKINELGQNEKAKRVHLHDDTGRAKAKAINLLAEDVLEPIKLCLSALRRDRPKVDVASHHLEIIEENVEKGLKWFKK